MKRFFFFWIIFSFSLNGLYAQNELEQQRQQFLELDKLIKFIQRMKDAGLTDEQIQQLDLKDDSKKINIIQYIEEIRAKKVAKDAKVKAFLEKNFLTVKDLFQELSTMEPNTLANLRNELVSE